MADPVATARSTFLHSAPAEALFFHMGNHHATRVDCPTLGLEFTDNAWLGSGTSDYSFPWAQASHSILIHTDPEGTLFFNDAVDFSDTTETSKYKVTTQQYNGIVYAIITFYWDDIGSAYAQFVGEDPVCLVYLPDSGEAFILGSFVDRRPLSPAPAWKVIPGRVFGPSSRLALLPLLSPSTRQTKRLTSSRKLSRCKPTGLGKLLASSHVQVLVSALFAVDGG